MAKAEEERLDDSSGDKGPEGTLQSPARFQRGVTAHRGRLRMAGGGGGGLERHRSPRHSLRCFYMNLGTFVLSQRSVRYYRHSFTAGVRKKLTLKKTSFYFVRGLRCCPALRSQVAKMDTAPPPHPTNPPPPCNKSPVCSCFHFPSSAPHAGHGSLTGLGQRGLPCFPRTDSQPQACQLTFSRRTPLAAPRALEIQVPIGAAG